MKKLILTSVILGAALGIAACTPASQEADDAAEPEAIVIEGPVIEEPVIEGPVIEGPVTEETDTPALDHNGNPVDQ